MYEECSVVGAMFGRLLEDYWWYQKWVKRCNSSVTKKQRDHSTRIRRIGNKATRTLFVGENLEQLIEFYHAENMVNADYIRRLAKEGGNRNYGFTY